MAAAVWPEHGAQEPSRQLPAIAGCQHDGSWPALPWQQLHMLVTAVLLQAQPEDLTGTTKDRTLSHALEHGLGFLHETMSEADQELVGRYFTSGAIQVLVVQPG